MDISNQESEFEKAQFEVDMLTVCNMFSMPYEEAVEAARREFKELRQTEHELNS